MDAVQQAFICAYATPSGCIFFDEKMARVDYNLYKLALTVLLSSESRALITELQREILPSIPVVGSTLLAASSAAETAGHVATAGVETAQVVENLIKLGYQAAVTVGPLFPLYRDAQELDMVVVVDMLARRCEAGASLRVAHNQYAFRDNLADYIGVNGLPAFPACHDFVDGMSIYKSGNGYLEEWRQFTTAMSEIYLADMTPSSDHFVEVSSMISSACQQMFTSDGLGVMDKTSSNGAAMCASAVLFPETKTDRPKKADGSLDDLSVAENSAKQLSLHNTAATAKASSSGSNAVVKAKAKISNMPLN